MQSFNFDLIQQPDIVVHQNTLANGTTKYKIKTRFDTVFQLFIKLSLSNLQSMSGCLTIYLSRFQSSISRN